MALTFIEKQRNNKKDFNTLNRITTPNKLLTLSFKMLVKMMLTEIFCVINDSCNELEIEMIKKGLKNSSLVKQGRKRNLCKSEIITIIICFPRSKMKTFKSYYNVFIKGYFKNAFNKLMSYNRFVELMKKCLFELHLFIQVIYLVESFGIN